MKQLIENLYNLEVSSIIKKTDKTYVINTKDNTYILKYVPSHMENIYIRVNSLEEKNFLTPIKSKLDIYVNKNEDKYFTLTQYLKNDSLLSKEARLSFYFKSIAYLHKNSIYPLRMKDAYLDDSISYLDEQIQKLKGELETRIERVEKDNYHSPSDWFFIMNYQNFMNALNEATLHLNRLEDKRNKEASLNLTLTYQNFTLDHILVNHSKIVSLENMAISPSIYDLYDVISHLDLQTISLDPYLKDYLDIYPLKPFEKEWLLAMLFIPPLKRKEDDLEDLNNLLNALKYIKKVEEIAANFLIDEQEG